MLLGTRLSGQGAIVNWLVWLHSFSMRSIGVSRARTLNSYSEEPWILSLDTEI